MSAKPSSQGARSVGEPACNMAVQVSRPVFVWVIGTRAITRPRGFFSTAVARTVARPSRKTCALTVNGSPSSTRAGNTASWASGRTSRMVMRPNRFGSLAAMAVGGMAPEAFAEVLVRVLAAACSLRAVRVAVVDWSWVRSSAPVVSLMAAIVGARTNEWRFRGVNGSDIRAGIGGKCEQPVRWC